MTLYELSISTHANRRQGQCFVRRTYMYVHTHPHTPTTGSAGRRPNPPTHATHRQYVHVNGRHRAVQNLEIPPEGPHHPHQHGGHWQAGGGGGVCDGCWVGGGGGSRQGNRSSVSRSTNQSCTETQRHRETETQPDRETGNAPPASKILCKLSSCRESRALSA